jgi:hypothetical protein
LDQAWSSLLLIWAATGIFWAAAFGAFVLYMLSELNDRQPFSLFRALQIELSKRPGRIFMDMFISSVIGAGVVLLVLRPESVSEACNAGLGLGGILSAFGKDV